ncbi:MAG TPA: response regulator [Terriglobales bacterium]|nr:response regulator [Terriglobales bacterium]
MRILTVDDNEAHVYALTRILEHNGFEVFSAHNAKDALEIARREHPTVALLDIFLPDKNGFELCASLRSDPQTKDIAVIFHSATANTASARDEADLAGASAFLTYPIDPDDLLIVVRGAVERARERRRTRKNLPN